MSVVRGNARQARPPAYGQDAHGVRGEDARRGKTGQQLLCHKWKAVEGATAAEKAAMRFFKVVVP